MAYSQIDIVLYKGTAPNKQNALHIFEDDIYDFRTKITDPAYYPDGLTEYKNVAAGNFRYNKDYLIFKCEDTTEEDLNEITYAVEYTRKTGTGSGSYANMRCFFVESAYFQSGNAYLKIRLDEWGTYIRKATLSRCHIARCNRDLGNGIYDNVRNLTDMRDIEHIKPFTLSLTDCSVVFLMEYNVTQSLFGNNNITKTSLFGLSLQEVYDAVHAAEPNYDGMDIVLKTIDVIGGIHSVGGLIGTAGIQLSAHVLKMWLLPTDAFGYTNTGLAQIVTKCLCTNHTDHAINNVYIVSPGRRIKGIDISSNLISSVTWPRLLPQYHIEVGAGYRGVPINRYVDRSRVYYHYMASNDGIKVIVQQGMQQEDITDSFETAITTNNATETSLMTSAKSLAAIGAGIAAVAKGYAKGGVVGAAAGAAITGVGLVSSMKDGQPLHGLGSGDGATTFYRSSSTEVNGPYSLLVTPSSADENEHARLMGVQYDLYNDDFATIQTQSYVGNYSGTTPAGTFIQIDDLHISGIPAEAENYVRNELARGIWYKVI